MLKNEGDNVEGGGGRRVVGNSKRAIHSSSSLVANKVSLSAPVGCWIALHCSQLCFLVFFNFENGSQFGVTIIYIVEKKGIIISWAKRTKKQ